MTIITQLAQVLGNNALMINNNTVTVSSTVAAGQNAMSVGPITISSGITVTISSGQRWVVL